jgi:hypothetical protein
VRPYWRDSITRVRAPLVTDEYGTPTSERDWANATETVIEGCGVYPVAGKEVTEAREAIVTRYKVFAPGGTDLLASDRIIFDGKTYEVDGDVTDWTMGSEHVEALLRRVEG